MRMKEIAGMVLTLFLVSTLTMTFAAVNGQTTSSASVDPFPQAGKFYTLVGRTVMHEIVGGEKIITHTEEMLKWSIQDVVDDIAIANYTIMEDYVSPETGEEVTMEIYDVDSEIALNRTILSRYANGMSFGSITGLIAKWPGAGAWLGEGSLDEDVGEHAWAWFPTDLSMGAEVPVSWTFDFNFLGDKLYKVVGEEVIEVLGERQECWKLHMPPSITDGLRAGERVYSETYWVDKDTGVPLKLYHKGWYTDGPGGWETEVVLVHTNIDLGPESTQAPSPTYTLTAPTSPGFPEAGKFWSSYLLWEGWYLSKEETKVTYYREGILLFWVAEITDDTALVHWILCIEHVSEAEGIGELERVWISCRNYSIGITARGILDVTATDYWANMTSLTYEGPLDVTGLFAVDIGEEAAFWLPTNLYMGANVDVSWIRDATIDNATYTVVDEKVVNALGEWQATWVLDMPPTISVEGERNVTRTLYCDKDVGVLLEGLTKLEAIDGSGAVVVTFWLWDTNVDLGPEVKPLIKLSGELDYLSRERVKIKLTALVRDANTMEPVSGADVTVDIYSPDGGLWISAEMVERLPGTGICEWESNETIKGLRLEKGLYVVHAQASFPGGPTATDVLEFHIDPPVEDFNPLPTLIVIVIFIVAETILLRKFIQHWPRRTSQKSNVRVQ